MWKWNRNGDHPAFTSNFDVRGSLDRVELVVLLSELQLQLRLVASAAKPKASTLPAIRLLFIAFNASFFEQYTASGTAVIYYEEIRA